MLILAASGFAAEPENLAPQAQVSATSEYSADYAARFAVEGLPMVTRHSTQTGGGVAWMNHGGSVGRVLGIVPVAPDGSFSNKQIDDENEERKRTVNAINVMGRF